MENEEEHAAFIVGDTKEEEEEEEEECENGYNNNDSNISLSQVRTSPVPIPGTSTDQNHRNTLDNSGERQHNISGNSGEHEQHNISRNPATASSLNHDTSCHHKFSMGLHNSGDSDNSIFYHSQECYTTNRQVPSAYTGAAEGCVDEGVVILHRGRAMSMPNVSSMMQAKAHYEIGQDLRKISNDVNMEYKDHHERNQRSRRQSAPAARLSSSLPKADKDEEDQSLFARAYRFLFQASRSQPTERPSRVRRYTTSNLETLYDEHSEEDNDDEGRDLANHSI